MHAVLTPIVLKAHGVRLEPLALAHVDGLIDASCDGALATLNFTSVPAANPADVRAYIEAALAGQHAGTISASQT